MQKALYHEKQVSALCGVHAINTLLQGPVFTEFDLAQVAQDLDALERQLMMDGGVSSEDYKKYDAEGSGNVGNDGMFSIQVLSKALGNLGLSVVSMDNPDVKDAKQEPHNEKAFICNLQEHWFSIRKVDNEFWNFNSLFPAPQPVTQFYLSAFLDSLKDQAYMIFVVRGPATSLDQDYSDAEGPGRWFSPDAAKLANDDAAAARQRGKVANVLEDAFSRADAGGGTMQLRPKRHIQEAMLGDEGDESDADLAAAIAASLGQVAGPSGGANELDSGMPTQSFGSPVASAPQLGQPGGGDMLAEDEDEDLAAAIAASLADAGQAGASSSAPEAMVVEEQEPVVVVEPEPEAGPGIIELKFRGPGSASVAPRRFAMDTPSSQLHAYVKSAVAAVGSAKYKVHTMFPRKEIEDGDSSLKDAGISESQMLNVMQA